MVYAEELSIPKNGTELVIEGHFSTEQNNEGKEFW
jgi:hypothetical protein